MAAKVEWSPRALALLQEAAEHIQDDSPAAAKTLVTDAFAVAATLSRFPARGRVIPELRQDNHRELFVGRYRLLYRIEPERISVLGLVHGARDFRPWWRRQQRSTAPT